MKALLFTLSSFLLLTSLWAGAFFAQLGNPTINSEFMHSSYLKKEAYANSIDGNKLVIVGGSSFLFGLDSAAIEQDLGKPVVNHAMAASLGVPYLLDRSTRIINSGDTVLLGMEYHHFMPETPIHSDVYLDFVVSRDPSYFRSLPLLQQAELISKISPKRLKRGLAGEPFRTSHIYNADNVSKHGDIVLSLEHAVSGFENEGKSFVRSGDFVLKSTELHEEATLLISNYVNDLRDKGVCIIAVPAPILYQEAYLEPMYAAFKAAIVDFYSELDVAFAGTWDAQMFEEQHALDTVYHVNASGTALRTSKLIQALSNTLSNACES